MHDRAQSKQQYARAAIILPLSLLFATTIATGADASNKFSLGERWRSYALTQLGSEQSMPAQPVSTLRRAIAANLAQVGQNQGWTLQLAPNNALPTAALERSIQRLRGTSAGIRTGAVLAPLGLYYSDTTAVQVEAILARQSFATQQLRYQQVPRVVSTSRTPIDEPTGQAIALRAEHTVSEQLGLSFGAQSKVDMSPFNRISGAYFDPGQFELPGRLQAEIAVSATQDTTAYLGVDRLLYSNVNPFLSRSLPSRFLSLLGDSASPEFAWRDLTVFRLEVEHAITPNRSISVEFTSRQQPSPNSEMLRDALATEYTGRNYGLRYQEQFSLGQLNFSAAYAPQSYFLGPVLFSRESSAGQQVEVELSYGFAF